MVPAPSWCGTTRGKATGRPRQPLRPLVSDGLTAETAIFTRTSPGPGSGAGISPKIRTSRAGPVFSYQQAFIHRAYAMPGRAPISRRPIRCGRMTSDGIANPQKGSERMTAAVRAMRIKAKGGAGSVVGRLDAEVDAFVRRTRFFREPMTRGRATMFVLQHRRNTRHRNSVLKLRVATNCPDWDIRLRIIAACAEEIIADHEHGDGRPHWAILEELGLKIGLKRDAIRNARLLASTQMAWLASDALVSHHPGLWRRPPAEARLVRLRAPALGRSLRPRQR